VDEESGAPVAAAFVRIVETKQTEFVNGDGRFTFARIVPGRYTLIAERIGYHAHKNTVEVRAGTATTVRLELHVAAVDVGAIVVTGALSARSEQEVLGSVSAVAGAELDRRLNATIAQTIQAEPGVSVSGVGGATSRPVIRGLGGDRILILEDGQRPGDLSSTSSDHAVAVDPLTAEQFEIVRGPMSLLYGSSALGGVVNIIRTEIPTTMAPHTHGLVTSQLASVNDGGTLGGTATSPLGAFMLRAEASGRRFSDTQTPVGDMPNTDGRQYTLAGAVSLPQAWGHTGASYRYYDNDYGIPGGFVGGHPSGVDIRMRRHTARAQLARASAPAAFLSKLNVDASYSNYAHSEIEASGEVATRFEQDLLSFETRATHGAHGALAQGAFGVRAQYRDITTAGELNTPSTYDYTAAVYAVEDLGTGRLRGQVGARYDYARYVPREQTTVFVGGEEVPVRPRTFGAVSGSIGALYALTNDLRAGASVSRAFRTPDFNELYSDGPHLAANSYDVGDPNIEHETGTGADAFLRWRGERAHAEVAVFLNQLSNYIFPSSRGRIESGPQAGRPRLQYTNQDARFAGAEGELEFGLLRHFVAHTTVSYVRAHFTSERDSIPIFTAGDTTLIAASEYPPFIPPLNGSASLRYDQPRFFAGVQVRWAAAQDRLGDFETRTAAYAVPGIEAGVRLVRSDRIHSITLRVDNILDTEYRDHLSRIKEILPEPGRGVSLLYRFNF
jgi:iron complex outermembrane receptor protein